MDALKSQIRNLPNKPGVYKYYDGKNNLLYIGKAKDLKKRVSSYFTGKTHSRRISIMVSHIANIEFTIVENEYEALLLENSLIKKHQPKYNVNLKDGKTYPFIAIKSEPFPRIISTRYVVKDGSEYYGPFVSGYNKNLLLEMLQRLFKIRTCNFNLTRENIVGGKFKVCLNYHINLCKGPCEGHQTKKDYDASIEKARSILKGKTSSVIQLVKNEMKLASENLEFEKANELKNTLEALVNYDSKSTVVNPKINNVSVFSIFSKEDISIVNYLKVVNGSVIQTDTIEYKKKLEETDQQILLMAIAEMEERFDNLSKEILVPFELDISQDKYDLKVPKLGDKKKLLELSHKNAFYYYKDLENKKITRKDQKTRAMELLEQVKKDLDLRKVPVLIECFDNSNMQGSFPVAAMSVFKNGKPAKKAYRHFNIKTVEGPDDFASMEEVLYRRYKRVVEENLDMADLIVIDGGKGQLNAAYKSLVKLGLHDKIDIIGIAKKLEEIYRVGDSYPLAVDKKSPSNVLIQQLRNEAHRFGITHHRNRRLKGSLKTELEMIDGIGKSTSDKLLNHFKSVKKIKESSLEEIEKVVGKAKAKKVADYFL